MSSEDLAIGGSVLALWRYPVKSMMGEDLNATEVGERGLIGDRAYALIDSTDGKVVSAKNPRKWPLMFNFRAALTEAPSTGAAIPPVRIVLPDGTVVTSDRDDVSKTVSGALGREVTLQSTPPDTPGLQEYWPDMEGLDQRDTVTDEAMPVGTFFDGATVHLLTTATIDALRQAAPTGRFEVRRFRPNIVVQPASGEEGFVENDWIGHTLAIGDQVRLKIENPCPRCVMTTLPQGDLPKDLDILGTAVKQNDGHVGVYAAVLTGGTIRRGDAVRVTD